MHDFAANSYRGPRTDKIISRGGCVTRQTWWKGGMGSSERFCSVVCGGNGCVRDARFGQVECAEMQHSSPYLFEIANEERRRYVVAHVMCQEVSKNL